MEIININKSNFSISGVDLDSISDAIKKELCSGEIKVNGSTLYYKSKQLDFSNDEIILKIDFVDNYIKISDNNRTMLSLLSSGFDPFSTKHKEYLLESLAESCGVNYQKYGEIFITTESIKDIGEKVFWMIHAIQRLTETVIVGKMYRPPSFKRDVSIYLKENNRKFIEDPFFSLGTKLRARIDFSSELEDKEIICRAMSYTKFSEAVTFSEKFVHETMLIRESYKKNKSRIIITPVAIIDDSVMTSENEPVFNDDVRNLMGDVKIVSWSERKELLEVFPS